MALEAARRGEAPAVPRVPRGKTFASFSAMVVIALAASGFYAGSRIQQASIFDYTANGNVLKVTYAPPSKDCEPLRMRAIETTKSVRLDIVDWAPAPYVPQTMEQRLCMTEFTLSAPLGDRVLRFGAGQSVKDEWARVGR